MTIRASGRMPGGPRLWMAAAIACVLGRSAAAADTVAATRPAPRNVVLIISDDQHWRDYGFMGHEHLRTPNLDRLARESLVFPRGYATSSLCCPSLASIITGRFPHEHRIVGNDQDDIRMRLRASSDRDPGRGDAGRKGHERREDEPE